MHTSWLYVNSPKVSNYIVLNYFTDKVTRMLLPTVDGFVYVNFH